MMSKEVKSISRQEARHIVLSHLMGFCSLNGDTIKEDFYNEISRHYLFDPNDERLESSDICPQYKYFVPSESDAEIIRQEFSKMFYRLLKIRIPLTRYVP